LYTSAVYVDTTSVSTIFFSEIRTRALTSDLTDSYYRFCGQFSARTQEVIMSTTANCQTASDVIAALREALPHDWIDIYLRGFADEVLGNGRPSWRSYVDFQITPTRSGIDFAICRQDGLPGSVIRAWGLHVVTVSRHSGSADTLDEAVGEVVKAVRLFVDAKAKTALDSVMEAADAAGTTVTGQLWALAQRYCGPLLLAGTCLLAEPKLFLCLSIEDGVPVFGWARSDTLRPGELARTEATYVRPDGSEDDGVVHRWLDHYSARHGDWPDDIAAKLDALPAFKVERPVDYLAA
jgi:hypothetical protein